MSRAVADKHVPPTLVDAPLLPTKLAVAPTPDWLVPRPRLPDLVTAGTQGPLTLIVAPAGAGKTILLGSWVRSGRSPGPVAWLSLESDDDEQRFWIYLLAALQASGAVPPDGSLAALALPQMGHTDAFLPLRSEAWVSYPVRWWRSLTISTNRVTKGSWPASSSSSNTLRPSSGWCLRPAPTRPCP